jgi:hypothetical protein
MKNESPYLLNCQFIERIGSATSSGPLTSKNSGFIFENNSKNEKPKAAPLRL